MRENKIESTTMILSEQSLSLLPSLNYEVRRPSLHLNLMITDCVVVVIIIVWLNLNDG